MLKQRGGRETMGSHSDRVSPRSAEPRSSTAAACSCCARAPFTPLLVRWSRRDQWRWRIRRREGWRRCSLNMPSSSTRTRLDEIVNRGSRPLGYRRAGI